ncbi:MAG: Ig-like domain-containing protein [Candidatus Poribacteria bacterium]|nr:Ig-like domain-containing protein [Candidatus Poribacteria bacterium]
MRDFQSYFKTAVVWIAAIGLVFGSAATAAAQQISNFEVTVSLTDRDGNAASGLKVVFQNTSAAEGSQAAQEQALIEDASNPGSYSATLTDLDLGIFQQVLIPKAGDVVSIRATQTVNGVESPWSSLRRAITQAELDAGEVAIGMTESGLSVEFQEAEVRGDGVSTATLVVTVMDSSGALVDDPDLDVTTSVGSLSDFTSLGSGMHQAVFTAPLTSQDVTATVTVTYGADSGKATVSVTGVPADVMVSIEPMEIVADGASTAAIMATLMRDGAVVANETLTIRATLGTVSSVTNNGDGTYTATYTAGTTAGTAAISVTASAGDQGAASLTLTPGAPASIAAAVDPTEIRGDSITTAMFTATIEDANGNGVSGLANVMATLTGGGSLGDVTDGGDGTYSAVFTSPLVREDAVASVEFAYGALTPASAMLSVRGEPEAETTLLVVKGLATYLDRTHAAPNGLSVMVENVTTGAAATSATGDDGPGRYTATFFNPADPNAVVASSNDLIRVTVTDPVSNESTMVERRLTAAEVNATVVIVDVETSLKARASNFVVKGLVQYSDGTAAVLPSERLTVEISVGAASQRTMLNDAAAPGEFEAVFASVPGGAAFEVTTGDLIRIAVFDQDGTVVAGDEYTYIATSEQIINGEIELEPVLTSVDARSESLLVSGVVKYSDGAAPVSPALGLTAYVTVGDYSENLMINDPNEPGVFTVTFVNLPGISPFMTRTGDMVSVEVRDNGNIVATMSRPVTSQEIIGGAFDFSDILTSLPAMSDHFFFVIAGMVAADVGIEEAPDGSTVRVTNLSRRSTSLVSANNAVTNGSYSATLRASDVGGFMMGDVANTGDILLVEAIDPNGMVLAGKEIVLDSQSVIDGLLQNADILLTGVVIDLSVGGESVDAGTPIKAPYNERGVASATVEAMVTGSASAGVALTFASDAGSFVVNGTIGTFSTAYAEEMYFSSDSGPVMVTVSAGDKASRTLMLNVVDETSPKINSIMPVGPLALVNEDETLTADVSDNTAVASIEWDFWSDETVDMTGDTATMSFSEVGRVPVTLVVTDVAGNSTSEVRTIDVLDLQFATVANQAEYDENGVATVGITLTAIGPDGMIDFSDSVYELMLTDGVSSETSTFMKTYETAEDLGDHELTATVTNADGQTVSQSLTVALVDLIAPMATLTSVAEPLELVGQPVDVGVEVVENTEIASIEWRADGEVLESRAPTAEETASGVFAYTYMQEGDDPAPALVNITFHVMDTSDNTNDADTPISVPVTFVDVEFSAETLEVPYDENGVASTGMTVVVNGPDGVVTPESAGLTLALTPDELFPDLETFSKTYESAEDLGEHEVTLTVTSEAGEQIVKMLTLNLVDLIDPAATLTSTAEPLKEAGQSVMVSVDVVENTEIASIEWRVDGEAVETRMPEADETAFSYTYMQEGDPAPAHVVVSFHVEDTSGNRNDSAESGEATPINVPITFVDITFSAPDLGPDMEVAYDENGVAETNIMAGVMGPDGDLPMGGEGLRYELAPAELFTDAYNFMKAYESVDDLGPHEVSLTVTSPAGEMIVKTMMLTLVDNMPPMVSAIAADSTNQDGIPFILVNRDLTLSASASDNTEILTVEWVFPDKTIEGMLDADGNTSVTRIFEEPGDFVATLRVVDAGGNEETSETMVKVRRVEVGGLALDSRGAAEFILSLLQSPLVNDLLTANGLPTIPMLLGDDYTTEDVLRLLNSPEVMAALQQAGLTLPNLPAMLNPVIVPNMEDLYLENFGNALFVPSLETWDNLGGVAGGSYRIENGLTLTGHKLSLFAVAPKAMEVIVTLHGSDGTTYSASGMSAEETGTFQHEFAIDEELFLGTLPAWPASESSPVQEVTLRLSANGIDGPYMSVPLTKEMRMAGGYAEPVWSATEMLNAGGTYYYYYVVEMTHQIPVGGGKRTAKMLVIPDPRNLQLAPTIDIGSLSIADIQDVADTGRVPLVSKFSVPGADGLWTLNFDLNQIPDGDYEVSVTVDGEPGFDGGTRPLSINRTPEPVSDVTVEAVNGATHYIDENGAVVTTNANNEGALSLTAEAMTGGADIYDRTSVIFQVRPVTGEPTVDFWTTVGINMSVTPIMEGLANDNFLPLIVYANQIAGGLLGRIGPEMVRTEMMDYPQVGSYLIRAVSIDQFSNMSMSNPQAVEVVPRTVGEFNVSYLGIGNLKGNEAERYISADVPKDGSVAADDFRIWSDTTQANVTIRSLRDVSIPLTRVALQSSTDGGATWTDLKVYEEADLAAVDASWMSDMTSHMIDGVQLVTSGVTEYRLRVMAENRLMISGVGPETVLVVDALPIPVAPEVLAFAAAQAEGTSVSPDSGGARDQLVLTVDTPFNMLPKAPSIVLEISADGGQTFSPLAMEMGGPEAGTIPENDHMMAGETPEVGVNRTTWTGVWDTTMVEDTVENMEPEARDASMDDNPYMIRASLMGEGGTAYMSETLTIPVDNVDDVPPISSTVVTMVEREAKTPGTFEAVDANEDGSYTVRSDVRITASVTAGYLTIEGGEVALVVVDESGAVMDMLGDAAPVVEGQESYSFVFDSTAFPNGALRLAVLATDASGNQELTVMDTTVVANIANILISGLLPDDPGVYEAIRLTRTGVLMTNNRTFATPQADRPISGMTMIELDTENAMTAEAYISANMADLMDEALVDATPMVAVGENGAFQLPLDVSGLADGEYYVRIVLAASPNVFAPLAPVAFTVDNTAPPLTIEAPASGTAVNTRPTILSEGYEDPTGIVTVGLTLSTTSGDVQFTGFAGGNADMRLAGNEDLVNADGMTTDGLMFAAPQIRYVTPSDVRHASGSYMATGTATDYAGNVATVSVVYVIEQDATAPTVTAYSPTGIISTRTPTVSVSFTEDNSGVTAEGVSIKVRDSAGNAVAGTTTLQAIPLHLGEDYTADDILEALNSPEIMEDLQQDSGPQLSGVVSFIADEDLANGAYSVVASVADVEGNESPVSWEFTVYVDDNPPVITEFSPTGTIETADTTLSATFYDEMEVTSVTFTVDDGEPMDADEIADNTSATLAVTGLADGSHTVVVTATDALGNVGSGQFSFTVSLDLEPPVITAFSPTGVVEMPDATLAATFSDASEVMSVTFAVDGGEAMEAVIANNTSATLDVTGLSDGDHMVMVTATDEHGNVGSAEYHFTVSLDLEAPVITAFSPTGVVESPDTTLAVVFSDASKVTSVTFAVDGGDAMDAVVGLALDAQSAANLVVSLIGTPVLDGLLVANGLPTTEEILAQGDLYTRETLLQLLELPEVMSALDQVGVPLSLLSAILNGELAGNTSATLDVTGLSDGGHTVMVTATDEHGNVGFAEYQFTVSLDLEPPVITTVSPTGVVEMPDATLAVSLSDASMVTSVTFSVDGGDAMDAMISDDNTSATLDVMGLSDGDHMVMVTAMDEHGNVGSAEYQFTVSLDLEPPVITTVSPTGVVEMPDATLAVSLSDASMVTSVTFSVDGGAAMDAMISEDNTSATLDVTGLSDGDHMVMVTAMDEHGNVGSAEYQFTVSLDLEPPVITTVSPTGVVEMPDATLAVSLSDASMVTSVTFSVDGGDAMDAMISDDNTSATLDVTGLSDGDHMVMVTAMDEHGNVGSAEYQFTVSLDLEPPVITTVSPTGVVEMPDATLAVSLSDASMVTSVTFSVDGGAAMDAMISEDNTSATLDVTGLSDGDHMVMVTATDEHGNVGSAEYQFTVSLDLEPPVITTVSPTGVVEMPDATLAVSLSDASMVTSVTFSVDGGDAMDAMISDDNTSATLDVTDLSDGDHMVMVTATDEHGNVGSAEYQFTVSLDLEPPVITTVSPTGVVEMPDATLAVSLSDASMVTSVTFSVDGGAAMDAMISEDNTSATLDVTGLSDGDHMVMVTATDEHGNVGSAEYQFTVSLDLEPPVITTVSPTGTVESADTTLAVVFSDASNVTSVTFSVDGGDAMDAASISDNTMARLPVTGLSDGDHMVMVTATDEHGNVGSAEYQFTVSLDTTAPIITSISPTGVVRTADTTLAVNFFDDSEVDSVTFSVDGGAAMDAAEIIDNSRAHLPVDGLSQGSHTVVVTATDEHGNKASAQYSFLVEIDMIPPTIVTMTPAGYVRSLRPLIAATFTDNLAGVDADSVVLMVDGAAVNADVTDSSVSYQPSADLATGTHEVMLTLADALGNETSTSWTFTIETTPPSILSVAPRDGEKVGKNVAARTDVVVSAYYIDADSGIDVDSVELTVTLNGNRVAGTIESRTESGVAWMAQNVLRAGIYTATVSIADNLGNATEHSWSFIVEEEEAITIPVRVVPNPFEKDVAVWVGLGKEAEVRVRIYDLNGRLVAERPGQILLPGRHAIDLSQEICNYGRGVYICQVIVDAADRERVVKIVKMAKIR